MPDREPEFRLKRVKHGQKTQKGRQGQKERKELPLKRYIVRKYVMARSIKDAFEREWKYGADDVFLDQDYKVTYEEKTPLIGFMTDTESDYWE